MDREAWRAAIHGVTKSRHDWVTDLSDLIWPVLWRLITSSRTNTKKNVLFIVGNWNAKVGSQEIPGVTGKFGLGLKNEAGQRLAEFCQENILVIANTLSQQPKRWLYTWTSPDGRSWNQIDYVLWSWSWRGSIQSVKTRPGADCCSNHELLIAKFRLNLKKVGKRTFFRFHLDMT